MNSAMRILSLLSLIVCLCINSNVVFGSEAVVQNVDGTTEGHSIKLKYWNGRGLMETARVILAVAGKFPDSDYEDGRYNSPPDSLESNLGRMPVMHVTDDNSSKMHSIGQSLAIYYYLATEHGLFGDNTLEAAQIVSIAEHLRELKEAYKNLVGTTEPSQEQLDSWFEGGPKDSTGTADASQRPSRYLTWYLGRIEGALSLSSKNNIHAVGSRLSLADILMYGTLAEYLTETEAPESLATYKRQPFGSKARLEEKLKSYPKIAASINAVAENANVQKWLATRGPQGF